MYVDITADLPPWTDMPWHVRPDQVTRVRVTFHVPLADLCRVPPSGEVGARAVHDGVYYWLHGIDPTAVLVEYRRSE